LSRDIELLTVLNRIKTVVRASESYCGGSDGLASWKDDAALVEVFSLACRGSDLLKQGESQPALALTNPAPQSSVQIEQAAKGPPRVTVKAYDTDPFRALELAAKVYDQSQMALALYAEAPKEGAAT
jgi:hypothetical protein